MAKAKSAIRIVADTTRAASLELAPLLKPHKRHGKLLLRVERMQRFARLSHGHNNGDGSWSLATDELEDLEYLVPEGTETAHTLEVRIVAIDHGTTVATFEVPITLEDFKPVPEGGSGAVADTLTRQQRADFEALKISLAERDAELSSLRSLVQQAESELPAKIESAMTLARDGWSAELEKLLTTANSQARAELEKTREAWLAEQNVHASRSEEKVTQARETLQRETENAIAVAEKTWQAAETARFAKAEAEWRIASETLAVELKAKCERAEVELARARAEVDEIRKAEQSGMRHVREDLAHARADAAKREQEATELRKALRDAEVWTKAEGERLAKAQTSWRDGADKIAGELKARCERAERALAEATAQSEQHRKLGATEQARVKEELAALREALAKRDRDLAERQNALQKAEDDQPRKTEAALAAARESWKKELEQNLTQAGAQFAAEIDKRKAAWLADQNVLLADAKKAADEQLEAERERLSREARDTRTQAEATWKAAESARLARAELEWREKSGRVETELKARSERAEAALAAAQSGSESGDERDQALQARLLEDVAKARMELAERDAEAAQLKNALLRAEAEIPAKTEAAVARAREGWMQEVAQGRETAEREAAAAHAQTEAQWKDAEAARLAKHEAEWREQSDQAMAALKARCESAEAALADAPKNSNRENHGRLIDELAVARTQLAERGTELAKARAGNAEAVERQRKEADAALAKAKDEWIDAELERLSAAETQWRKHSDELLAIATTRCEKAENELAQLRAQPEGERATENDMVVGRLHDKIALLQSTLSERDRELAVLRMTKEPSDFAQKSRITLQRDLRRDADGVIPAKKPNSSNRLARDIALVGAFAVLAVVLWPQVEPLLPDSVQSLFSSSSDTDDTADSTPAPAKPAQRAAVQAPPPQPTATIIRSANLHADPTKSGDVLDTIARGAKVTVIGQHGNWTEVRVESADGKSKPQDGWVYNTYLSTPAADTGATAGAPQSATKP